MLNNRKIIMNRETYLRAFLGLNPFVKLLYLRAFNQNQGLDGRAPGP